MNDLEYTSCNISNGKELEAAVSKRRWYPPSISCLTTYRKSLKKSGDPTKAVLVVEGADKPMEFVCTAYKYRTTGQCIEQLVLPLSLSIKNPFGICIATYLFIQYLTVYVSLYEAIQLTLTLSRVGFMY